MNSPEQRFKLVRLYTNPLNSWKNLAGWWEWDRAIYFHCPHCGVSGCVTDHSISSAGEINNSVLCKCGKFHEWCVLEGWPEDMEKFAGQTRLQPVPKSHRL